MESLMKLGFANENLTLFAKYIEIHTEELQLFNRLIVSLILNSNENHDQKESNIE
jgi:hypothetical protein